MQRLEVSGAVRLIYRSLDVKGFKAVQVSKYGVQFVVCIVVRYRQVCHQTKP